MKNEQNNKGIQWDGCFTSGSPQSLHVAAQLETHSICLGHDSNTKREAGFNYPRPDPRPKAHITMTLF